MSAPHFHNALPLQSMLQEYRIDQVLGVGGFGITYRARDTDRKSTRLNSSHMSESRMPSSA